MDFSFQQIVIIVAVILLIVTLTVIGYMMNSVDKLKPWPPVNNQCPDGWIYDTIFKKCGSTGINVGSMITDISCSLTSGCGSLGISSWTDLSNCISGWVRGNSANFRDPSMCYMLANVSATNMPAGYANSPHTFSYAPSSDMQENVDWAKAFDISWDGLV